MRRSPFLVALLLLAAACSGPAPRPALEPEPEPEPEPICLDAGEICCPPAPRGYPFAYLLRPGETRSIKPRKARCAYREDANRSNAMVALIEPGTNALIEVERVIGDVFDVAATLDPRAAGQTPDPNFCANCHPTRVGAGVPAGHYIFNGRDLAPVIERRLRERPGEVRTVVNPEDGREAKGLRNDVAPYDRGS